MRWLLRDRTHLVSESLGAILGNPRSARLDDECQYWASRGVELAAVFHGSDVRDPDAHLERNAASYFRDSPEEWVKATGDAARRRRTVFRSLGIPGFVSTPDLLLDLPEARWCPLVIDVDAWAVAPIPLGCRVRVLHVPSRRVPPVKGTPYIDRALATLDNEGVIDYVSPTFVDHAAMPALVASADIVVDQIMTGSFGVAAVEALAAGRVVVGNVSEQVRAHLPLELPVVDACPSTVGETIRRLVADRDRLARLAEVGPHYARQVHDGRVSAAAIRSWLIDTGFPADIE